MSHPPPPDSQGSDSQHPHDPSRDPLWILLDRARQFPPSPHFARHVMAAVQAEHTARQNQWAWLHRLLAPSPRPALAMATLALILAGGWWFQSRSSQHRIATPAAATTVPALIDEAAEEIVQALASDLALLEDVAQLLDPEDGLDLDEEDMRRLLF